MPRVTNNYPTVGQLLVTRAKKIFSVQKVNDFFLKVENLELLFGKDILFLQTYFSRDTRCSDTSRKTKQ